MLDAGPARHGARAARARPRRDEEDARRLEQCFIFLLLILAAGASPLHPPAARRQMRQQAWRRADQVGDEVITTPGHHRRGSVRFDGDRVHVEVAPGTTIDGASRRRSVAAVEPRDLDYDTPSTIGVRPFGRRRTPRTAGAGRRDQPRRTRATRATRRLTGESDLGAVAASARERAGLQPRVLRDARPRLGLGWSPHLGLDLEGGLSVVYKPAHTGRHTRRCRTSRTS